MTLNLIILQTIELKQITHPNLGVLWIKLFFYRKRNHINILYWKSSQAQYNNKYKSNMLNTNRKTHITKNNFLNIIFFNESQVII